MKLAQSLGEEFYGQGHPLMSLTGISSLVSALTSNLFTIGGGIFVFVIIFAGYNMLTAAGDERKFETARNYLTAGVVGAVLLAAAWLIIYILEAMLGTSIIS